MGVSKFSVVQASAILGPAAPYINPYGNTWFVKTTGSNGNDGKSVDYPVATISKAVSLAAAGDNIIVGPGAYDETVTISRSLSKLVIWGQGGRGAAFIEPSTEDAAGMLVHADDVSIYNLGIAAEDDTSATALTVTGSRFRGYSCKIEGGAKQVVLGPGTIAQEAAATHGRGGDIALVDCEICWGTQGIVLQGTDFGAATQVRIHDCWFHNLTTSSIDEAAGSGGAAGTLFRNLWVIDCTFDDAEDGTAPTAFILLNDNNANTGIVTRCSFPTAINGGKNLVSTALHWVSNYHTGGVSTGQPS